MMSATEVCSPIRTAPIFPTIQVACRAEPESHADFMKNVEYSNMETSGFDPADPPTNERGTSVEPSPRTDLKVTSELEAMKLETAVGINEEEEKEKEDEKEQTQAETEEGDEDEEVRQIIEEPLVVASNELTVETSVSRSKSPLDIFGDVVDEIGDAVGELAQAAECAVKTLLRPPSLQELPENNVHVIHPRTKETIGFGLHIEEHRDGCHVARVIEDGLAFKSKLQTGDIINKVNGFDLKGSTLEDITKAFTKMNVQEQIILVITRLQEDEDGQFHTIEIQITITLTLSDDNVTFEVEVEVTSSSLRYQSRTQPKYIFQSPRKRSTQYLIVNGNRVHLSTYRDEKARFRLELYGGGRERVCVLRHSTSSLIIDKRGRSNGNLIATVAPNPNQGKVVRDPGSKFFYWYAHPNSVGEDVFESVSEKDFFINVTSDNSLVLQQFSSAANVPSSARFKVVDA